MFLTKPSYWMTGSDLYTSMKVISFLSTEEKVDTFEVSEESLVFCIHANSELFSFWETYFLTLSKNNQYFKSYSLTKKSTFSSHTHWKQQLYKTNTCHTQCWFRNFMYFGIFNIHVFSNKVLEGFEITAFLSWMEIVGVDGVLP